MSKNPPVSSTLPERARDVIRGYSSWEQRSARASGVTACVATEPGVKPTCCDIHQGLYSMLLCLHEQAAALEEILVESKAIERSDRLGRNAFPKSNPLIIIQRKDTEYSFARFSPGWFEMFQDFFRPQ